MRAELGDLLTAPLRRKPRIYYLAPDYDAPSWGVGLLYEHVRMLRGAGHDAMVVHVNRPFRLSWLEADVPLRYLSSRFFRPRPRDVLVVPEILAGRGKVLGLRCRRLVFVQNAFLMLARLTGDSDYAGLGYEGALTILPHLREITERYFGVGTDLVPPFVAPYFFTAGCDKRRRQIVVFPKAGSRDYETLVKLLRRELKRYPEWRLVELRNLEHREVARVMGSSAFFASVNCREAFNTTVPEAMAAGCVPVCYQGFGGRDYLRDGVNAFVFANNEVFALLEKLLELVAGYDARSEELERMRENAAGTAAAYTREATEAALLDVMGRLLSTGP